MNAAGFQQGVFTPQLYIVWNGSDVMLYSETTGEMLDAATDVPDVNAWLEEHRAW